MKLGRFTPWNCAGIDHQLVSTPAALERLVHLLAVDSGTLKSLSPPRNSVGVMILSAWKNGYEIFIHRSGVLPRLAELGLVLA